MKNKSLFLLVLVVSMSLVMGCGASSEETAAVSDVQEVQDATVEETATSSEETVAETTEEAPVEETAEESEFSKMYEAGTYKVGTDIDAGKYVLLADDDENGYFKVSADANGDDITFNDNFETNALIEIQEGDYVKLSRCIAVDFDEYYASSTIGLDKTGVTLRIGYDLPAGEYKLEVAEGEDYGYYCIYEELRQDDIISNDNFENSTYVEVTDGQFLKLSRCFVIQ